MPFHLVATNCQRAPTEDVIAYLRSQGLAENSPNFTLTSFGGHPAVKGNGYVPYYMVFDHRGRLIREHMCGDYHGGDGLEMIEWVEKALKDALTGQPSKYITRVANRALNVMNGTNNVVK